MLIKINLIIVSFIGLIVLSFIIPDKNEPNPTYCGFEMTIDEINKITEWNEKNPNAYNAKNGNEIYTEINDSIRKNMPDTVQFEIFLIKLTKNEVCIDVIVNPDKKYFEKISCALMQSKFSDIVPRERKIRIYTYTTADGSGDIPFEVGLKSNR